jgi:cell division protein FtsB
MAGSGGTAQETATRTPGRRLPRTRQEIQNRRRRALTYVILLCSTVLMVDALVGENGYLAKLRARRDIAALSTELTTLQNDNLRLAEEASRLRTDPNAVEEAARRDLGLLKPGEVLVVVRDSASATGR